MKKCLVFLLILNFFCFAGGKAYSLSKDFIEINLKENKIGLIDFCFAGIKINGEFFFSFIEKESDFIFCLEGKYIFSGGRKVSGLKVKLEKTGRTLYVKQLSIPQVDIKGQIDLEKKEGSFEAIGGWNQKTKLLEGKMNVKTKVWGTLNNLFTSGNVLVKDGKYRGKNFTKLRIDFLGKPPLLNITDSEIFLTDESIYKISGVLDLRNFSNILPGAKFVTQKASLGEWKVFSESDKNAGLKKNIDESLDVIINADKEQTAEIEAGAELRYNVKDDNFLKIRMQENKTIIGYERRKDF